MLTRAAAALGLVFILAYGAAAASEAQGACRTHIAHCPPGAVPVCICPDAHLSHCAWQCTR
jgi:hypothetical protein